MSQTKAELIDPKGDVAFDTNTFYVDATNNRVGFGTTSPRFAISVGSTGSGSTATPDTIDLGSTFSSTAGANPKLRLYWDGSLPIGFGVSNNQLEYIVGNASSHVWYSNGSERARIDGSGRLLVGTSSARSIGGDSPRFQIEGNTYADSSPAFIRYGNDAFSPVIQVTKTRSTTAGGVTAVQNGDQLAHIAFNGTDGSAYVEAANIKSFVDGTPGANDMPGRLVFSTTADGASSPTLALKIDSNQYTYFSTNNSSTSTTGWAGVAANPVGSFSISRAGSNVLAFFHTSNASGLAGTPVGTVSITTTATSYNTSSDYRLKENITLVTDGINRLQQLKPSRFNFIADPDKTVDGFIAHEVQAVVPEAVTGAKDKVDADGNPIYQGIDQSKLVPLLTAALQETIGEVESLKARVAALESA